MKLLKPKQVCAYFGVTPFDVSCPWCVEQMRTAWGCSGTCQLMGWETCPSLEVKENCGCPDGTVERGAVINGLFIGFTVLPELAALASYYCPDATPLVRYELSGYASLVNCVDAPGSPLTLTEGYLDLEGGAITRTDGVCTDGPIFLDVSQLGITLDPLPIGAPEGSVSCSQSGGLAMLVMRISADCDNKQIVLCPMDGAVGTPFVCGIPPDYCDRWELTDLMQDGCHLELTFTHFAGECPVTVTVNGTTLVGDSMTLFFDIDPCEPGQTLDIDIVRTWAECAHECAINNGTTTITYTVPD